MILKTGHTARMAEYIAQGVLSVDNAEAKTFSIDAVDADYVKESSAVIIGTPTYHGYLTARMKQWLETGLSLLDVAESWAALMQQRGIFTAAATLPFSAY